VALLTHGIVVSVQEPKSLPEFQKLLRPALVAVPAIGLVFGLAAQLSGRDHWSSVVWAAATLPVLLVLLTEIVVSLRRGDVGLDIVAALSMLAALLVGEYLAAVIVALMYAGGQYLESFAERRASREMTALLARVPRTALRHRGGKLDEVKLEAVDTGDRLLVRQGDVVPVDGSVVEGLAVLDQSALTGESLPILFTMHQDDSTSDRSCALRSNGRALWPFRADRRASSGPSAWPEYSSMWRSTR
jgi:cation transport ATPase